MKDPKGNLHLFGGVLKQVTSSKISFTWASNGGGTQQFKSIITVEFFQKEATTELRLTHENFSGEKMRERYDEGWNNIFEQLEKFLKAN